ncbi:MAG: 4-hydroxy-tetrahydrodipicolinate synthase [Flavobacteriales bacterium]|nr:4-hydroxy-tetrahydrodipicolinate synthase [Flavobacteriales bacterium]
MEALKGTGVALVTPFNEDGTVDFEGLTNLVNYVIDGGLDYLVALGTTGEPATMTTAEKDQVLDHIRSTNNGRLPLILGIGGSNTAALVEEFERVDLTGVDAILSASPYYNKPTQEGIYQHYKVLAEHSPLPLILYNVPGRTASNMTAQTTLRLAYDFENIVAMKEASGDLNQVMEIVKRKPEGFILLSGEDALNFPILTCGGEGVISVLANSLPKLTSDVVRFSLKEENEVARNLHYQSLDFINLLFAEGNPAGVKAALKLQGVCGNAVRMPLIKASDDLSESLKKELENL